MKLDTAYRVSWIRRIGPIGYGVSGYSGTVYCTYWVRGIGLHGYDILILWVWRIAENVLLMVFDQSIIYVVSVDMDTAYSSKSGNDPNSPMPFAGRAVDELTEFSGETEPSRYMNFFKLQQIFKGHHFLQCMRDEAQSSKSFLAQLNAMISKLEAMNDAGEIFDSLMCLRDDKRVESEKLSLLDEMIAMFGSFGF
nr:hypothetical protein [Tanacetum cinerariifolium]